MDGVPAGALLLRPIEKGDLAALVELAGAEGRNVAPQEYDRFLSLEGARGYVVTRDEVLLGAGTGMRYFAHGFLGPLLLRQNDDATGVAIAILTQLIEGLQTEGVHVIDAEAAPAEEAILTRMGFALVRRTIIMERSGPARGFHGSMPMEQHHLLDIGVLDAEAVGHGRKEYLAALRDEMPEAARVVERDGEAIGFAMLRRASRGFLLGPLITRAGDTDAAQMLARDTVAAAQGEPVVALVPEGAPAVSLLEAEGFRAVGALVRLRAGGGEPPGSATATEWALGGRITG